MPRQLKKLNRTALVQHGYKSEFDGRKRVDLHTLEFTTDEGRAFNITVETLPGGTPAVPRLPCNSNDVRAKQW